MKVKYSCGECGINKVDVDVPARGRAVDVVFWVQEVVARRIGDDHQKRSPDCKAKTIQNLMIPISDDDEFIGQEKK